MGYEARTFTVTARVSRHNEERDDRDDSKWCQMAGRISQIVDEYLGGAFITNATGTLPFPPTDPDHCVWCDEPTADHHPDYPPVTPGPSEIERWRLEALQALLKVMENEVYEAIQGREETHRLMVGVRGLRAILADRTTAPPAEVQPTPSHPTRKETR
ncbi:hypothetical protein ACGF12_35910 [Kitasatospora sp. NPDC048296]|uniref:hypothetical protein n=1 Tax=Kitasatospora sp. NPDC048296 TaxID=3364048 RepID=UPI0037162798